MELNINSVQTEREEIEKCSLCKIDSERGDKDYYAVIDMGRDSENASADDVVTLEVVCCKKCRSNFIKRYIVPKAVGVMFPLVGVVLTSIRSVYEPMKAVFTALPLVVFIISVIIGVVVAYSLNKTISSKANMHTHMKISEIDSFKELKDKGYEELKMDKFSSIPAFKKADKN